jgi:hypothetical protein
MRAVWSFWSKPYLVERSSVWVTPAQHWMSWILSLETAKLHLPDTALYTDTTGAELLVDKLGLRFGAVSTELDALAEADPEWWAIGKLHTYALQTAPFIHIDNDVFLWKPLPGNLIQAGVFAQHPEEVHDYYNPHWLEESLRISPNAWLPAEWKWYRQQDGPKFAPCCGIVGGNNFCFLRNYARKAIRMVDHPGNRSALQACQGKIGHMILIEQYFLSACLAYHAEPIEHLFGSWMEATNPVHSTRLGYTHLIGPAKKDDWIAWRMKARVETEYPALFERVNGMPV